jgi:hypothetical protein
MKRIYIFLALLISIFIQYGCDDSSVNIIEYRDNNIKFQQDSLYLKDNSTLYTISFYGINFKKFKPDSIKIDNYKFDFKIISDSLLKLYIKSVSDGYQDIHFYFPTRKITLEKKIKIINEFDPPSSNNLYITPYILIIDTSKTLNTIFLHGINFYKNNIDSVVIGNSKWQIGSKELDKLEIYCSLLPSGDYEVAVYSYGKKITLKRNLMILNRIIDFDILKFNRVFVSIQKLPILYKYSTDPESQIDYNQGFSLNQFTRNIYRNLFGFGSQNAVESTYFTIAIDSQYRVIKQLIVYTYRRSSYSPPYREDTGNAIFYNVPFSVNHYENDKIELAIEIDGKSINDYLPLTEYNYSSWGGSPKNNDRYYGKSITKVDSISGQKINFYPATDSSSIKIYLRNF